MNSAFGKGCQVSFITEQEKNKAVSLVCLEPTVRDLLRKYYLRSTLVTSWLVLGQGCAFDKARGGENGELPPARRLLPALLLVFPWSALLLLHACSVPAACPPAKGQSVMLLEERLYSFDKFSALNWLYFSCSFSVFLLLGKFPVTLY